jgi:hypothetical protein
MIWTLAIGALYSLGYLSFDIREVMSDGVPMEPSIVGVLVLFCLGATLGLSISEGFAPATYIADQYRAPTSARQAQFRVRRFGLAALMLTVTAVVLSIAFFGK